MAAATKRYTKFKGFADTKGQMYEVKISAFLFLRGLNSGRPFQLASNVEGAGAFDDIVFKYQPLNTNHPPYWHTLFVQLKHKSRVKVQVQALAATKGDFSTKKYFDSFSIVKETMSKEVREEIFSGCLEHSRFIIYTNAELSNELLKRKCNYCQDEHHILRSKKITERVIGLSSDTDPDIVSCLDGEDQDDSQNFLKSLEIFSGAPTVNELDDFVEEEILKACKLNQIETKRIASIFLEEFCKWCQESNEILDENSDILKRAVSQRKVEVLEPQHRNDLALDLEFKEQFKTNINEAILLCVSFLHIVPQDVSSKVSTSKLISVLEDKKILFTLTCLDYLFKELDSVLSVWRNTNKHMLVIVDNAGKCGFHKNSHSRDESKEVWKKITDVLKDSKKRVVFLSSVKDEFVAGIKEEVCGRVLQVWDTFKLCHLTEESSGKVLDRKITFQGEDIELKHLVWDDLRGIDQELINFIVDPGAGTVIGRFLDFPQNFFIDRTLIRCNYVDTKIFKTPHFGAVYAISGITDQELTKLIPSERREVFNQKHLTKMYQRPDDVTSKHKHFVTLNSDDPEKHFNRFCESNPSVHWFHMGEGRLMWKKTHGKIIDILSHVVEDEFTTYCPDSALDLDDRVVLLVAEPGMGKTTLITHLAQQAKKNNPSDWVIIIRLNDHVTLLDEQTNNDFHAAEFLTNMACIDCDSSKEKRLFQHSLHSKGNVIVILDGVDELPESCIANFETLANYLISTLLRKVWITSRHSRKNHLEIHFSTIAFSLKKFTSENQINFIANFWSELDTPMTKIEQKDFIKRLLEVSNESMADDEKHFAGIPLQTKMLAETFKCYFENPKIHELPKKLNILELYKRFVESKFNIAFKDNLNNRVIKEGIKKLLKWHTYVALKVLLQDECLEKLKVNKFKKIVDKFIEGFSKGEINMGIVDRVINGKAHFVHKTFSEYFVGIWIAKKCLANKALIESYLYHDDLHVVRCIFDRKLSEHHELHTAVLDGNVPQLQSSLEAGADANGKDEGGRTPLHLAAAVGFNDSSESEVNLQVLNILLKYGANVTLEDDVLQWTPLQYADKTMSYDAVDLLLKQPRVNECDIILTLKIMKNRSVLHLIVKHGFEELLHFLLDNKLSVEAVLDEDNSTIIHKAAANGQLNILKLVIERFAKSASHDNYNETASNSGINNEHACVSEFLQKFSSNCRVKILDYVNAPNVSGNTALAHAAFGGHVSVVEHLANLGANLHSREHDGFTCLHWAAYNGHMAVVQSLLENVSDNKDEILQYMNAPTLMGCTAVSLAAQGGHIAVMELLADLGADFLSSEYDGYTCFHWAAVNGHLTVLEFLLEKVPVNRDEILRHANAPTLFGDTPAALASQNGHIAELELLCNLGTDFQCRDNNGWTCLHWAAYNGHVTIVQLLLEKVSGDTDEILQYADAPTSTGKTAMSLASQKGHVAIVDLLASLGVDFNSRDDDGWTCLHYAARYGHVPVVRFLLKKVSVSKDEVLQYANTPTVKGDTALSLAALGEHIAVLELLATLGADFYSHDKDGWTSLHRAVYNGQVTVIQFLLERVYVKDEVLQYANTATLLGNTPMSLAAQGGHIAILELLSSVGVDLHSPDNDGWTCLHSAAWKGQVSVIQFLIETLSSNKEELLQYVNARTLEGNTAISLASEEGHLTVLELLASLGADVQSCDNDGWTCLHKAAQNGHVTLVQFLLEKVSVNKDEILQYANARTLMGYTAMTLAAQEGHIGIIEFLVSQRVDCYSPTRNGWTCLHYAARSGHVNVVQFLLENVSVRNVEMVQYENAHTLNCSTSVSLAPEENHVNAEQLCGCVGDITARNDHNSTTLTLAAEYGHLDVVKFILKTLNDEPNFSFIEFLNNCDNDGDCAVYCASAIGHSEVVQLLVDSGANVTSCNNEGKTALHIATLRGHISITRILIDSFGGDRELIGSFLDVRDSSDMTALNYAVQEGHADIIDLLCSKMV